MKPHIDPLLRGFLFPLVCFSEADQELWEDDPIEFLQKKFGALLSESKLRLTSCRHFGRLLLGPVRRDALCLYAGFIAQTNYGQLDCIPNVNLVVDPVAALDGFRTRIGRCIAPPNLPRPALVETVVAAIAHQGRFDELFARPCGSHVDG